MTDLLISNSRPRRHSEFFWRMRRRAGMLAAIGFGWIFFAAAMRAQQPKPQEYQVKAVYLYNFGRFIVWPTSPVDQAPFTICILGRDPFGATLDATLAGESIGNRKLLARRITSTLDATSCQILFISSSEESNLREILSAVNKPGILTVSDLPGFTDRGGMIQFVLQDDKVRFQVNLGAAEKSGLMLSSQLLKVAVNVSNDPRNVDGSRQ